MPCGAKERTLTFPLMPAAFDADYGLAAVTAIIVELRFRHAGSRVRTRAPAEHHELLSARDFAPYTASRYLF